MVYYNNQDLSNFTTAQNNLGITVNDEARFINNLSLTISTKTLFQKLVYSTSASFIISILSFLGNISALYYSFSILFTKWNLPFKNELFLIGNKLHIKPDVIIMIITSIFPLWFFVRTMFSLAKIKIEHEKKVNLIFARSHRI